MKMTSRRFALALVPCALLGFAVVNFAVAHNWLGDCDVSFDNAFALENISTQARATFAVPTKLSNSGDPVACLPQALAGCWTYRHHCHANYINVESMNYTHFHLSFEDATLNDPATFCFVDPGDGGGTGIGRKSGSDCVPANWGAEPRILDSHDGGHWIKIWLEDDVTGKPRVFDLPKISVSGTAPIRLWFRRTDGTWWCWNELSPRNQWKLEKWAHDLIEVRIRGTKTGGGSYRIRRFTVQD